MSEKITEGRFCVYGSDVIRSFTLLSCVESSGDEGQGNRLAGATLSLASFMLACLSGLSQEST